MRKAKVLYVGHSYHNKTASTAFFIELLRSRFEVEIIWDESWQSGGPPVTAEAINVHKADYVIFFQLVISCRELRRIRCRRTLLVPMHDYVVAHRELWPELAPSGMRTINFCRATHEVFTTLGFESLYVQYWSPPAKQLSHDGGGTRIFFWPRISEIGWPVLKALLGDCRPQRIIMRTAPDPGHSPMLPNAEDMAEYRIEVIDGWIEKARYFELLASCNLFMAPRRYEGIGLSFLEALSMGLAVIAPDSPTMNEYIHHGINGFLYSVDRPQALDLSNLDALCAQALEDSRVGHQAWLAQQHSVLDFITRKPRRGASMKWRLKRLRGR